MIRGTYFDGRTSNATTVEVQFGSTTIRILGLDDTLEIPVDSVTVSEPLGRTNRSILLEDGARIDLPDTPELDRIGGRRSTFQLAHALERHWKFALSAAALVIGASWVIVTEAIPFAAKHLSAAIPATVDETISDQGLAYLDRAFFEPSTLSGMEQGEIRESFMQIVRYSGDDNGLRLEFRNGGEVGANALALPSGIVIVTDELVELAQSHEELAGVLGHEVGHIVNRHGMRLALQASATAMLVAVFTGDIASLSSLAASIPTLLVQTGYSRGFEREADAYAYDYLEFADIPAERFATILQRLEDSRGGGSEGLLSYLSTHPPASERAGSRPD